MKIFKDTKEQILFEEFNKLKTKQERILFLSQIQEHEEYTNAQRIYSSIYQQTRREEKEALSQGKHFEFNPFENGLNDCFSKEIAQELRIVLEQQRLAKQKFIKETAPQLYHVSVHSPDEIQGQTLQPRLQFEQFRDRGQVCGVFASPNQNSAFHIRGGKDNPVLTSDMGDERIVLIADKEKFLKYQEEHPFTYIYEVENTSFEPNIGYDGHYHGEWISKTPVKLGKHTAVSIQDVIKKGTQIYFVKNPQDFKILAPQILRREKNTLSQLIQENKIIPYISNSNFSRNKQGGR